MGLSRYTNTENLKITYLFGAGASYNSVPIWNEQGKTMERVSRHIFTCTTTEKEGYEELFKNEILLKIVEKLKFYSQKAFEFGTLDIYARSLYLLKNKVELNALKYHLSIYFDIWENFIYKFEKHPKLSDVYYSKIDKRYFSLLSVLLDKGEFNPKLNSDVSFISWNYDLQMEYAYRSFMNNSDSSSLDSVNESFKFYDNNEEENNVVHLNGFRGCFNFEGKLHPNVEGINMDSLNNYLLEILRNKEQFRPNRAIDYSNNIKYAWEANSESLKSSIEIFSQTNILIIVGYSFPSYNREIDSKLISALGTKTINSGVKQVIYQNPNANIELLESICGIKPKHIENTEQFYIPHEFLFPQKGDDITFD